MEDTFDVELTAENKAKFIKQLDHYLEALRGMLEQMARSREEIDRNKAETWALLAQMRKAA
ncbi:MAG: hypothetical protein ACREBD_28470 [Blastocatellia bacterium]